ncbi:mdmC [Scenedesmus sp. PABB004]|nr:mdmC [Scenedesmus sp. PABB004]
MLQRRLAAERTSSGSRSARRLPAAAGSGAAGGGCTALALRRRAVRAAIAAAAAASGGGGPQQPPPSAGAPPPPPSPQQQQTAGRARRAAADAAAEGWVVNKAPIGAAMTPALYAYLLAHTREHPLLAQLRAETAARHGGHMQVAPEQGQLLALLAELLGARRVIEVGVFTGYSSLAVALALPPDGELVALDRDADSMAVAQRYWDAAGVGGVVRPVLGPAAASLDALLASGGAGRYDLAFIDADKRSYAAYFEQCLALVRAGGLIAVDNVLFYGKVADPGAADKATVALRAFNDALAADARVSVAVVPVGDGMALCRKR